METPMLTADLPEPLPHEPRHSPTPGREAGRLAPLHVEPPHPDELIDKLVYRTASDYKKAVLLAEHYAWQAHLVIERRAGLVQKCEMLAERDRGEASRNSHHQLAQAQARYKARI